MANTLEIPFYPSKEFSFNEQIFLFKYISSWFDPTKRDFLIQKFDLILQYISALDILYTKLGCFNSHGTWKDDILFPMLIYADRYVKSRTRKKKHFFKRIDHLQDLLITASIVATKMWYDYPPTLRELWEGSGESFADVKILTHREIRFLSRIDFDLSIDDNLYTISLQELTDYSNMISQSLKENQEISIVE